MKKTISILPETDATTLCLSMTGLVTANDYMNFFDGPLRQMIDKNGFYSLFITYDGFEGWTPEAADLSFKCIASCGPKARKAAYVNPPDSRMILMKTLQPIMTAEVRYFNAGEDQDALHWIKS